MLVASSRKSKTVLTGIFLSKRVVLMKKETTQSKFNRVRVV